MDKAWLRRPTGAAIVPFASVGDGSTISGVNVTLDDTASSLIPGGSPLVSGSYKPTAITGSTTLVFPTPAPSITAANYAATDGAATLTSQFGGTAPNGTWALYAMDNSGSGAASIGGGWCVNITPTTVQTTITTTPANLLVSADGGTPVAAPLVESWVARLVAYHHDHLAAIRRARACSTSGVAGPTVARSRTASRCR